MEWDESSVITHYHPPKNELIICLMCTKLFLNWIPCGELIHVGSQV